MNLLREPGIKRLSSSKNEEPCFLIENELGKAGNRKDYSCEIG